MDRLVNASRVIFVTTAVFACGGTAAARSAFTPEPISSFSTAYGAASAVSVGRQPASLSARHADPTKYHAYRFIIPETVMVGVAKAIVLDNRGRVHFIQEGGAPVIGRPNPTHRGYSHILVPISVTPP